MMKRWIVLCALLWVASPAWADPTDSHMSTPATGASVYAADSPELELGANKYLAMGIRLKRKALAETFFYPFAKVTPSNDSYGLYVGGVGDNYRAHFYVDRTGTGAATSVVHSVNSALENYNVNTLVGQYMKVGAGTSGLTLWVNGSIGADAKTAGGESDIKDGTAPLAIGSSGPGYNYLSNVFIYGAWLAFADIPIIDSSDTVAVWSRDPAACPLPFAAGSVSRYFLWDATGARQWPAGVWADSGVSAASGAGSVAVAGVPGNKHMTASNRPEARLFEPVHPRKEARSGSRLVNWVYKVFQMP